MVVAFGTPVRNIADHPTNILLMFTGFDRDLGVAGRVMTRASDGSIVQKLVKVDRPSKFPISFIECNLY